MQVVERQSAEQIRAAVTALSSILGEALLAVYLHGSAVSDLLRPQSDIDLLAVVGHDMTARQRAGLLAALLNISGRHPVKHGAARCIEVMVMRLSDLDGGGCPARAEFIYGEWLREDFEAGRTPMPVIDPEHILVLAQARRGAAPLLGRSVSEVLPEVSMPQVRQAIRESLPALLHGLEGDERNVLLTLARMWFTACTGEFATKDDAAAWAIPHIRGQGAVLLGHACRAYRGELVDEWSHRTGETRQLARYLRNRVAELLQ